MTGLLILVLSMAVMALRPKYIYWVAIFSIPFSATAVVNFYRTGADASALMAPVYFAILVLIGDGWSNWHGLAQYRAAGKYGVLIVAFLVVVVFSWTMPYLLSPNVVICSPDLQKTDCAPLSFSFKEITQTAYLAIWMLFSVVVMKLSARESGFRVAINAVAWSVAFVSLWGMMQWFFYHYGYEYPKDFFNNSASRYAIGYLGDFSQLHIKRVSSVAVEPSILAQYMLVAIPLLLARFVHVVGLWPRVGYGASLFLGCMALVATATTTAIVGLVLMLCLFLLAWLCGLVSQSLVKVLLTVVALTFLAYQTVYPNVDRLVDVLVLDKVKTFMAIQALVPKAETTKAETSKVETLKSLADGEISSYSTAERAGATKNAWVAFKSSPILGVGWRNTTSYDLVVTLLANTGLVGLVVFFLIPAYVLTGLARIILADKKSRTNSFNNADLTASLMIALVINLIINQMTGFGFVYGQFWLLLGFSAAMPLMLKRTGINSEFSVKRTGCTGAH